MKARIYAGFVAALLACGCGHNSPYPPPASPLDIDDARETYKSCVTDKISALDDGSSDASAVAMAVRSACETEIKKYLYINARGVDLGTQLSAEDEGYRSMISTLTGLITQARADRRHGPGK